MKKYEFFDHTADIGVKVFGKDLKDLFTNAAVAMFEIIATKSPGHKVSAQASPKGAKSPVKKFIIDKQADSLENLLVGWLDELLYLFAIKNIVFEKFEIKELDVKYIKALAFGLAATNFDIKTEVKAVTYHMLEVKKKGKIWQARVVFDV